MTSKNIALTELKNYNRYNNALTRCKAHLQELDTLRWITAEQRAEEREYLEKRIKLLQGVIIPISASVKAMSKEEYTLLRLKYWSEPARKDIEIAKELNISSSTYYRIVKKINKQIEAALRGNKYSDSRKGTVREEKFLRCEEQPENIPDFTKKSSMSVKRYKLE